MKTKIQINVLLLVMMFAGVACKKDEGKGGKLSIKGKVHATYYNKNFTVARHSNYAPDEDVFIMYGDETINGDDVKTSPDGSYEFKYLQKGKYKIYSYSIDLATMQKIPVVKEVDLTDNATLEDINVNLADKSEGAFAIRGKVYVYDYDDSYTIPEYQYYGMDEDVFLIEEGDSSYSDKTSTNYNGMYEFKGLRKGKYKLYVFSEGDETVLPGGHEPVIKDVEIVDGDLMLTDFNIIKN